MIIETSCAPGFGFNNCPRFHAEGWVVYRIDTEDMAWELKEVCPWHDLLDYDYNYVRVIKNIKRGIRVGLGPSKADRGFDISCCVM